MKIQTELSRNLSQDEITALNRYGTDSTYFHATSQGRGDNFSHDNNYQLFIGQYKEIVCALDSAISTSKLLEPATLHAAHGNGIAARGSLIGPPETFIGLTYCYAGFISTTSQAAVRDRFLKRSFHLGPIMLEFRLPSGFNAVDMHHSRHAGEFEYLLGRNVQFDIVDASVVQDEVMLWVLQPSAL